MVQSYIEHSQEVVASLDPEEIASMTPGQIVYHNSWFERHALGSVTIGGGETLHLAIEQPIRRCNAQGLFLNSLSQAIYMLKQVPELAPHLPSFMGAISNEEQKTYWAKAVLTEDPTEGGCYTPEPVQIPDDLMQKIVQFEIPQAGVHALAVNAIAGQHKIMSLFPRQIHLDPAVSKDLKLQLGHVQERLTVVADADSTIAGGLREYAQIPE